METWSVDWKIRPLVRSAQPNPAIAPVGASPTAQYYRNALVWPSAISLERDEKLNETP